MPPYAARVLDVLVKKLGTRSSSRGRSRRLDSWQIHVLRGQPKKIIPASVYFWGWSLLFTNLLPVSFTKLHFWEQKAVTILFLYLHDVSMTYMLSKYDAGVLVSGFWFP